MQVDISIIIVNYNVQYFIEQCLNSIFSSSDFSGNIEVYVIDNNSTDDSIEVIEEKFPQVRLIKNEENVGFSIANNQGIKQASGKYVLLLNPDTLLSEDTLSACYNTMENSEDLGALGVRMVDGAGKFLPESKRGFPSPLSSFFRFTGIFKLFPRSEKFNNYYQGHIAENERAETEVLCGAFMFIKKKVLDEIGMLDEAFFMYGEDIDLSYRIRKAGYNILYLPETSIVHFKGESTRKDSVAYTKRFYNAMDIFAKKHFKGRTASIFLRYLSIAIWTKAALNFLQNGVKKIIVPIIDLILIFGGLYLISFLWARFYFNDVGYYENAPLLVNFSVYTAIWFIFILFGGGYDKQIMTQKLVRNIIFGTLVILATYGLLNIDYRSSRAIILLAAMYCILIIPFFRFILAKAKLVQLDMVNRSKRLVVLAGKDDYDSIEHVLKSSSIQYQYLERLPVNISEYELKEIVQLRKVDEIICNVGEVGMTRIIELMSSLGSSVLFKITGDESLSIIGSHSKNTSGEIYTIEVNYDIQLQKSKRNKRAFDLTSLLILSILFPISIFIDSGRKVLKNALKIISGKRTILGYESHKKLPKLKPAIFQMPFHAAKDYAQHYTIWKDLRYLWRQLVNKNGV